MVLQLIQLVSPAFAILETSRRMESTGKDRGKQVDETTPSPSDTQQTAETGPAQPQNQSSGTNNGRQEPKEKESTLLLDILVHLKKDAEVRSREDNCGFRFIWITNFIGRIKQRLENNSRSC